MTTRSKDYWKTRFEALEDEQYQRSQAYFCDVQEQFRRAQNSIQMDLERWYRRLAENNDISYASAKRFLNISELEEFKWSVEEYVKVGQKNALNQRWMKQLENASARYHISYLKAMKLQMQQHAELLFTEFEGGMTDFLQKSFSENYYRSAYEIARGTGVGTNLAALDFRKIDALLKRPWAQDGKTFSDRIWANKDKLVQSLHTELAQNIIRGELPQRAIDNLARCMQVSRSQAGNLIMTESAAISSVAQEQCFQELDIEAFEVVETLDSYTCPVCQYLDGKHFPLSDFVVGLTAPPFHPRCRGSTCPYFNDEFTVSETRAVRDSTGGTYYVPDMTYRAWKQLYVEAEPSGESISDKVDKMFAYAEARTIDQLPERYRTDIEEIIASAPEPVRSFTLAHMDAVRFKNIRTTGRGRTNTEGIWMNLKADFTNSRGKYTTAFHEIGHALDRAAGRVSSASPSFGDMLRSDFDALVKAYQKQYNINIAAAYAEISQKIQANEYHAVSDLFGAMSKNQCVGRWKHGEPEYWNSPNRLEREAFAHFYSATMRSSEEVEIIKSVFPTAYKEFLKLFGG